MNNRARSSGVETSVPMRLAVLSILGFWAAWLVLVTARAAAMGWPDQTGMLIRRCALVSIGMALTLLMHLLLGRLSRHSLTTRAAAAFILAVPATTSFAVLNTLVFYRWFPVPSVAGDLARWNPQAVIITAVADGLVTWYFFFAAWAAFYLAISYVADVRAAERAAAASQSDAREARLAMLRLQVDPHFLFNALNALSSLIACGQTKPARLMVADLAAFFRAGLAAELTQDVPLADEIEMQRLYLAIEQARFGDRLAIVWQIPEALQAVQVPPLILQPLIENAVKYGVARSLAPVRITIAARAVGHDAIEVTVDDSRSAVSETPTVVSGSGIGLANVRGRLATRYGSAGALSAGPTPSGWRAAILVPANG